MNNTSTILAVIASCVLASCGKQTDPGEGVVRHMQPQESPVIHQVVEAETLTEVNGKFATGPAKDASAANALIVPPGIAKHGKITGQAIFTFDSPKSIKVTCWLRVKWTGTCSNSVIVKTPGVPPKIVGESATYNTWHWVKGPTFTAPVGPTKIELGAREDGVFIDQLMLTSDLQRVPVGIESAL